MKDVPTWLPEGTVLPCNLIREETNDVFISKKFKSLRDLPDGAVIGSASLRRQAQLQAINKSWRVVNFRGNVQTRLKKIENGRIVMSFLISFPYDISSLGVVDATLLALAGLKRLNMHDLIEQSQIVNWDEMLPAVAQGAIGIQCRSDDQRIRKYLDALNHAETKACVDCERSFLARLDGNCRTPIAGQAKIIDGKIIFEGLISKPDGSDMIRVSKVGDVADAIFIGNEAGDEIRTIAGPRFIEYQQAVESAHSQTGWAKLSQ